jgi:hypothetical protein
VRDSFKIQQCSEELELADQETTDPKPRRMKLRRTLYMEQEIPVARRFLLHLNPKPKTLTSVRRANQRGSVLLLGEVFQASVQHKMARRHALCFFPLQSETLNPKPKTLRSVRRGNLRGSVLLERVFQAWVQEEMARRCADDLGLEFVFSLCNLRP